MKNEWNFTVDEAKHIGSSTTNEDLVFFTSNFKKAIETKNLHENFNTPSGVREGEFFGIEKIERLIVLAKSAALANGSELVGLRFYYGLAYEDVNPSNKSFAISTKVIGPDSELRPRLFLVGVDAKGADIVIDSSQLKGDPTGNGAGGGAPTPPYGN